MKIKLPMFSVILPLSIELKFYWYRALFAIFIYPVASLVISVGDTSSYLSGASAATNLSTMIMNNIGNLSKILSPVGINLIVCLVTTKFILWALKELKYTGKTKFLLYCILFTPSFTLYTSIVSKESIDAIGCCLFIVGVFEALSSKSFLNKKILLSIIIFSIFKSAYLLFIVDMLVLLFVYGKLKKYPDMIMLFGIFLLAIHVGVYYYFREIIENAFLGLGPYFAGGLNNRTIVGGYLDNYIIALFLSFHGLTFGELFHNMSAASMVGFLESVWIDVILIYMLSKCILRFVVELRLTGIYFLIVVVTFFMLLSVQIFFSYYNPGSAIRYRNDFLLFIVFIVAKIYDNYVVKRQNHV